MCSTSKGSLPLLVGTSLYTSRTLTANGVCDLCMFVRSSDAFENVPYDTSHRVHMMLYITYISSVSLATLSWLKKKNIIHLFFANKFFFAHYFQPSDYSNTILYYSSLIYGSHYSSRLYSVVSDRYSLCVQKKNSIQAKPNTLGKEKC